MARPIVSQAIVQHPAPVTATGEYVVQIQLKLGADSNPGPLDAPPQTAYQTTAVVPEGINVFDGQPVTVFLRADGRYVIIDGGQRPIIAQLIGEIGGGKYGFQRVGLNGPATGICREVNSTLGIGAGLIVILITDGLDSGIPAWWFFFPIATC